VHALTPAAGARLFFALWPEPVVAETITRTSKALLKDTGGKHPIAAGQLHITLAFLGHVDAIQYDCVSRAAINVRAEYFELALDTLGYFPRPQVIWLAPRATPPALNALVTQLLAGLSQCEVRLELRPFVPHMTIQRKAKRATTTPHIEAVNWPVREFVLAQSVTYAEGAQYSILKRWPLTESHD
jgi:RNA 2',3'-cyclic 3'-phosphodiesterase